MNFPQKICYEAFCVIDRRTDFRSILLEHAFANRPFLRKPYVHKNKYMTIIFVNNVYKINKSKTFLEIIIKI